VVKIEKLEINSKTLDYSLYTYSLFPDIAICAYVVKIEKLEINSKSLDN